MSCREELDLAGAIIDSLKFAADEDCMAGRLAVSQLTRLAEMLARRDGWLECRLAGCRIEKDGETRLGLQLNVSGRLALRCQRCLGEVDFDCAIDNRLLLIAPGADWPEEELESDDFDAIPANRELSVLSLVEEEVLLTLPIVPRHADCQPPVEIGGAGKESEPSPFAVLAGLKKH